MNEAILETNKRIELANEICEYYKPLSKGIILTGSVAYSPNHLVNPKSDLDLLVISEDIRKFLPHLGIEKNKIEKIGLMHLDAYLYKTNKNNIDVSIHFLSKSIFDIIPIALRVNLKAFRTTPKDSQYILHNFHGETYSFNTRSKPIKGMSKESTKVLPISFCLEEKMYIGIHRDKLLSNPQILYEDQKYVTNQIETLWEKMTLFLKNESLYFLGKVDLNQINILNALHRKENMTPEVIQSIKDKTKFYLERKS